VAAIKSPNQVTPSKERKGIVARIKTVPPRPFCLTYKPGVKRQVVDIAINGSGIRDTSRVLSISKNTVIRTLKKVHCPDTGQPDTDKPV
jgi:hypothetical protein